MKKRLEAELISIAHRVLKLKNKSEVDQLYKETQKLYETLTILKFYGDGFETYKSEISAEVFEEKLTENFEAEEFTFATIEAPHIVLVEEKVVEVDQVEVEPEVIPETTVVEETGQEVSNEPIFKPAFELAIEEETTEIPLDEIVFEAKNEPKQISFEDFLGENYTDPVFIKPDEVSVLKETDSIFSETVNHEDVVKNEEKVLPLNETFSKSIFVALNDRVGFVKYLFAESNEDYNRVLSQLNTFDTLEEAKNFVEDMVKPDYNNWQGKEDYAERFMEIVAQKFV
jgi:hypothetical protein